MSNVLKLNSARKLNVQVLDDESRRNYFVPSPEEVMKKKLESAYKQGFEEGENSAETRLAVLHKKELESAYGTIKELADKTEEGLQIMERNFAENIFELAVKIAEKIIRREFTVNSALEENVKLALNKISGAAGVTLHINPSEEEKIRKFLSLEGSVAFNKMKIEPDERMLPGECTLESEVGNVDTRIESQIIEIEKNFQLYYEEN